MNTLQRSSRASMLLLALLASAFSLFAAEDEEEFLDIDSLFADEEIATVADPLRPINKAIFAFNDFVYMKALKPVSKTYQNIMPNAAEKSVGNFFDNIKYPVRLVGNLMQGKMKGATQETGRFLLDTTVGIGGLFKPSAKHPNLNPPKEDISQGLAAWGFGHGFYIVMPFTGPTTLRGVIGGFGDRYLHPVSEPWSQIDDNMTRFGFQALEIINESPYILEGYESIKEAAFDPYESLKNGYIQLQESRLKQKAPESEEFKYESISDEYTP